MIVIILTILINKSNYYDCLINYKGRKLDKSMGCNHKNSFTTILPAH